MKGDRRLPHEALAAAGGGTDVRLLAGVLARVDLEVCLLVEDALAGRAGVCLRGQHGGGRGGVERGREAGSSADKTRDVFARACGRERKARLGDGRLLSARFRRSGTRTCAAVGGWLHELGLRILWRASARASRARQRGDGLAGWVDEEEKVAER